MNLLLRILLLVLFISCSSNKEFIKENVCSPNAINYIKNSRMKSLKIPQTKRIQDHLAERQEGMQQCYEEYQRRTGLDNFQTCLVVGIDEVGQMEYYNFSSQDIHSDQGFIQCAVKVTKKIPFWKYGSNYILLQSYNFY